MATLRFNICASMQFIDLGFMCEIFNLWRRLGFDFIYPFFFLLYCGLFMKWVTEGIYDGVKELWTTLI